MTEQWQELKETIIEMRDNDGTGTQQEVCKFLANLIDVLEKQMNDGWIPVSERLPENSGNYLITYCYRGEVETQEAVYVVGEEEDKWFDTTDIEITLAVIAWMPLPKPFSIDEPVDERVDE